MKQGSSGTGSAESLRKKCLLFWIGCGQLFGKFMCKPEVKVPGVHGTWVFSLSDNCGR